MKQVVNGVTVESNFDCPKEEAEGYVRLYDVDEHRKLKSLQLTMVPDDRMDYIDIKAVYTRVPFDRIARITGYLVGTVDRFNDAKKAELKDRETHLGAGELKNHWRNA
jgi:hypothetical protein